MDVSASYTRVYARRELDVARNNKVMADALDQQDLKAEDVCMESREHVVSRLRSLEELNAIVSRIKAFWKRWKLGRRAVLVGGVIRARMERLERFRAEQAISSRPTVPSADMEVDATAAKGYKPKLACAFYKDVYMAWCDAITEHHRQAAQRDLPDVPDDDILLNISQEPAAAAAAAAEAAATAATAAAAAMERAKAAAEAAEATKAEAEAAAEATVEAAASEADLLAASVAAEAASAVAAAAEKADAAAAAAKTKAEVAQEAADAAKDAADGSAEAAAAAAKAAAQAAAADAEKSADAAEAAAAEAKAAAGRRGGVDAPDSGNGFAVDAHVWYTADGTAERVLSQVVSMSADQTSDGQSAYSIRCLLRDGTLVEDGMQTDDVRGDQLVLAPGLDLPRIEAASLIDLTRERLRDLCLVREISGLRKNAAKRTLESKLLEWRGDVGNGDGDGDGDDSLGKEGRGRDGRSKRKRQKKKGREDFTYDKDEEHKDDDDDEDYEDDEGSESSDGAV